jgi:hemin uptake protein HemP
MTLKENTGLMSSGQQTGHHPQPTAVKRYTSKTLFSGAREIVIEHAGDEYRLRLTNQGKLILTK